MIGVALSHAALAAAEPEDFELEPWLEVNPVLLLIVAIAIVVACVVARVCWLRLRRSR